MTYSKAKMFKCINENRVRQKLEPLTTYEDAIKWHYETRKTNALKRNDNSPPQYSNETYKCGCGKEILFRNRQQHYISEYHIKHAPANFIPIDPITHRVY